MFLRPQASFSNNEERGPNTKAWCVVGRLILSSHPFKVSDCLASGHSQWIQSFFNSFASTALAINDKLLLKYPFVTFVKAKNQNIHLLFSIFFNLPILYYVIYHFAAKGPEI